MKPDSVLAVLASDQFGLRIFITENEKGKCTLSENFRLNAYSIEISTANTQSVCFSDKL